MVVWLLGMGKNLLFGINRHRAWQIVRECSEKAGLPKLVNPETGRVHNVSPHRLRDAFAATHAVKLDDSGDGLRLLQEHLGHQSFNTTAKYRKVSGKEHLLSLAKAANRRESTRQERRFANPLKQAQTQGRGEDICPGQGISRVKLA